MVRAVVHGAVLSSFVLVMGGSGVSCLDRPVTAAAPTVKTNFTVAVSQNGIDKVDILFDIDNSASMGDKQTYLIQAIPQMVARLVTPQCLSNLSKAPTGTNADPLTGGCPSGSTPEFSAVHDMHIGVVTSSLGNRGGDACPATTIMSQSGVTVNAFKDDQGHLINRTTTKAAPNGSGPALGEASVSEGGGFLAWFPTLGNANNTPVTPPAALTSIGAVGVNDTLVGDFAELIAGTGETGCGIESQLESWYRFLIQPDPYASVVVNGGVASWSGVDTTILQQRHDFLRPDSLVAIVVLTDEDDSEIDVRADSGQGYNFMRNAFPVPRATSACESDPTDVACTVCPQSFNSSCSGANPPMACSDVNCKTNGGVFSSNNDGNDWGYDPNLRHVRMAQKYSPAWSPQFPLTRYFNGLTSTSVPNRTGEYPAGAGGYVGMNNCTNPLFAKTLPTASDVPDATAVTPAEVSTTLCALTGGAARTPGDVFFAHIGGVPHQLLQLAPGEGTAGTDNYCSPTTAAADCPQKASLTSDDWTKILGKGTATYAANVNAGTAATVSYDYSGIDPHMIESMTPRNHPELPYSLPAPASDPSVSTLSGPGFGSGADPLRPDPINGREWTTNKSATPTSHSLPVDREYACIFQLPTAYTDGNGAVHPTQQRDCATYSYSSIEASSCDCVPGGAWSTGMPGPTGNSDDEVPPLCSKASTDGTITSAVNDYTVQTYAKAYPTIRELTLGSMMGKQGIISSLCPIHTQDNMAGDDPLYGYRPAVNAIIDRLSSALQTTVVPELNVDAKTGDVPCLVLVSFPQSLVAPGTDCTALATSYHLPGYTDVQDPAVLKEFNAHQNAEVGDAATASNLANEVTCQLNQVSLPGSTSCAGGASPGWCYVSTCDDAGAASSCSQVIAYTSLGVVPTGATISLQCISTNQGADGGT